MANKKLVHYSEEKAQRNVVAIRTTMTFIVLKAWNDQLSQPIFDIPFLYY